MQISRQIIKIFIAFDENQIANLLAFFYNVFVEFVLGLSMFHSNSALH